MLNILTTFGFKALIYPFAPTATRFVSVQINCGNHPENKLCWEQSSQQKTCYIPDNARNSVKPGIP
jgi:hypothetical protein